MNTNHYELYNLHGPRCFLQELPGHMHFCMGVHGEDSSRLRNFGGVQVGHSPREVTWQGGAIVMVQCIMK